MRTIHRVFFGKLNPKFASLLPETIYEKTSIVILCAILIFVGLYPVALLDPIHATVDPWVSQLFPVGAL